MFFQGIADKEASQKVGRSGICSIKKTHLLIIHGTFFKKLSITEVSSNFQSQKIELFILRTIFLLDDKTSDSPM